jgi:hypothetical protein
VETASPNADKEQAESNGAGLNPLERSETIESTGTSESNGTAVHTPGRDYLENGGKPYGINEPSTEPKRKLKEPSLTGKSSVASRYSKKKESSPEVVYNGRSYTRVTNIREVRVLGRPSLGKFEYITLNRTFYVPTECKTALEAAAKSLS